MSAGSSHKKRDLGLDDLTIKIPETAKMEGENFMISMKEQAKTVIDDMPEDVSIDEIIQELAFRMMIDRGIEDSDCGRIVPDAQLEQEIEQW